MTHPVVDCAATLASTVKSAADVDPLFMTPDEKAVALRDLSWVAAQVAALRLRVLASADDLAVGTGARDPGAWLAAAMPIDARTAHAEWRLAGALERWEQVRVALAEGRVTLEQARVMTRVLADLPADFPAATVSDVEAELVRLAGTHPPGELRRLGAHLLTVLAPEEAEELEGRRLEAAERHASGHTSLTITPVGDGTTRVQGRVPDHVGARLRTVLESFAQPRVAALDSEGRAQPRSRLLGQALGQLLETLDPRRLPLHGGDATTVVVTIDLTQLTKDVGSGLLEDTGLTAGEVRRLACTARLLPAVLGADSEVLDLGRAARLFTPAQRKALRLRDRQCRAEGCTVPARWCDAHHLDPWSRGGATDLERGVLLCGHHHRRAHDRVYDATRLPNGDFRFHRRN